MSRTSCHQTSTCVFLFLTSPPPPSFSHRCRTCRQIRPLASTDYDRGHLAVLNVLSQTPDVGADGWTAQFHDLRDTPATYYIVVVVSRETDQVVASGGDIAVAREMQGKKLGLRLIQALTHISEGVGCYKTILNCSDANMPFYEKCGFEKRENEMAKYGIGRARTPRL
ncbi:hypothetical protein EDB83DRAFT_2505313 [Lactarius deliciosus]|nr:hypothetical protein EDB83DRAFT_2505313 [Lactarius deliciosus]